MSKSNGGTIVLLALLGGGGFLLYREGLIPGLGDGKPLPGKGSPTDYFNMVAAGLQPGPGIGNAQPSPVRTPATTPSPGALDGFLAFGPSVAVSPIDGPLLRTPGPGTLAVADAQGEGIVRTSNGFEPTQELLHALPPGGTVSIRQEDGSSKTFTNYGLGNEAFAGASREEFNALPLWLTGGAPATVSQSVQAVPDTAPGGPYAHLFDPYWSAPAEDNNSGYAALAEMFDRG